uniref:EGF-like domain-containing protein n=2 Tax=Ciona savignyi TaxID=51511 RepID=H2Z3R8_CIOSA
MSKNALIFPSTLNYRVSVNDSLSLRMILAQRVPIDELVWYHLFNFRTPRRLGGGQLQMNIRSVKYDDRGPYLVFFPVNNPTRRVLLQGLTMVVVRKCIAGKYGRGCELSCPPCENGAICDDNSGSCICPPGFKGELCEIACGPNKFGAKCQHVCSTDLEEGCKGKMFCMADPYGCSCATGLSGIICTLPCADSKYGEGCLLDCHCQLDKCDPYTGACLH